jgi:TetR/AcrR family transcriptional regulator, regulator of autoinduction and epiphytic fitness
MYYRNAWNKGVSQYVGLDEKMHSKGILKKMPRTKMGEANRDISTDKVEQILQGAMQEFLKHGYAGTSMDKVATGAGVSKATVYSHFRDKERLFKALIEKLARKKFQLIFGTEPLEGEPEVVIRDLPAKALSVMINDEEYRAFMRVLVGESGRFPELAEFWVSCSMRPTILILSKYLTAHPELKIADPEATARIMVGSIVHFMIIQETLHGKNIMPMESERLTNCLANLILGSRT